LEEEIERHVGSACANCERRESPADRLAKEIITFAEEGHYGLIVMGRRG
jgi:nucleotide-binding universal stress UspA family protein